MTNPLIQDLADAAGHVMTHLANALPASTIKAIQAARQRGAQLEVRVCEGSPVGVSLWMRGAGIEPVFLTVYAGEIDAETSH